MHCAISNFQIQGTARSGGMGNAFGALGGDFTSVSINPAGLGVYRSGELSITPTFGQTKIESSYLGSTVTDSKIQLPLLIISVTFLLFKQETEVNREL